ncbi:MAG: V-type ATP synthase subunit D [Nitrospirae bacterium]|nr:V-type ATP synthase subunit D [Nitrospirota bacterium]
MEERPSPNRMNLLNLRSQVTAAERGMGLLEDKRTSLVKELLGIYKDVMAERHTLRGRTQVAAVELIRAISMDGTEGVMSASFAAKRDISIDVVRRNIWGVKFSEIHYKTMRRALDARGYAFMTTSSTIDASAKGFEMVLETMLNTASTESHMRRIGDEVKKTARKINAIKEIIIPKTKERLRHISRTLEEREREDILRLKRLKRSSR